jgi:hypothetical protein
MFITREKFSDGAMISIIIFGGRFPSALVVVFQRRYGMNTSSGMGSAVVSWFIIVTNDFSKFVE